MSIASVSWWKPIFQLLFMLVNGVLIGQLWSSPTAKLIFLPAYLVVSVGWSYFTIAGIKARRLSQKV